MTYRQLIQWTTFFDQIVVHSRYEEGLKRLFMAKTSFNLSNISLSQTAIECGPPLRLGVPPQAGRESWRNL